MALADVADQAALEQSRLSFSSLTVLCRAQVEGQTPKVWPTRWWRKSGKKTKAKAKTALSKATPRQHKTAIDMLMILIRVVHRWWPKRLIVLVADGGYAAVKLAPTPCLLGLFSLVVLLTHKLHPDGKVPTLKAAWYANPEPTFSDCLIFIRKALMALTQLCRLCSTGRVGWFSRTCLGKLVFLFNWCGLNG